MSRTPYTGSPRGLGVGKGAGNFVGRASSSSEEERRTRGRGGRAERERGGRGGVRRRGRVRARRGGRVLADVGARDAQALVRALDRRLHRREAAGHLPRRRDVEVRFDRGRRRLVTIVDLREHGRGEGPALRPRLDATVGGGHGGVGGVGGAVTGGVGRVSLERVLERALDQRHGAGAVSGDDFVAALNEFGEELDVHRGGAGGVIGPEVVGTLLRELPNKSTVVRDGSDRRRRDLGAGVERPALVPRVRRAAGRGLVVGQDVARVAVADGVLELVQHVHPDRLVVGALLDQLVRPAVLGDRGVVLGDERVGPHVGLRVGPSLGLPVRLVELGQRLIVPPVVGNTGEFVRRVILGGEALDRADRGRALEGVALCAPYRGTVAVGGVVDVGLGAFAVAAVLVHEQRISEPRRLRAVGRVVVSDESLEFLP